MLKINKNFQPLRRQVCMISQGQPMSHTLSFYKTNVISFLHHCIGFKSKVSVSFYSILFTNWILSELTQILNSYFFNHIEGASLRTSPITSSKNFKASTQWNMQQKTLLSTFFSFNVNWMGQILWSNLIFPCSYWHSHSLKGVHHIELVQTKVN